MALTYTTTSTDSGLGSANVEITVTPDTGAIDRTDLVPGDEVLLTDPFTVQNTGEVAANYFITANWTGAAPTTDSLGAILAHYLQVEVYLSDENGEPLDPLVSLYTGSLSGLIDQPPTGQELAIGESEYVQMTFTLPDTVGSALNDIDLSVDFVFVATSLEPEQP